ncbi:MAG TPA: double-strand break repair protein AddB, partial [Sinorhizobium sp.]|nr:double-strand break repair protein AddB [Sinorhizobium sp.]
AIWLARNLAELIDSIETEELAWEALDGLDAGEHALWWQLTLAFLKIARSYWPERLAELRHSSPARHRNAVLRAETQRIADGKVTGPIIIAGSTGSIPVTAALIAAVKALPNGTIVLPGLDQKMSDAEWELIAGDAGPVAKDPTSRTHPQYGLHRLLKRMGVERGEVPVLGRVDSDLDDRNAVLSHALLPAKATDSWTRTREDFDPEKLLSAFADVALVEAANEREEATAIAIALRLALEGDEESQAALITPDRGLARRVGAELARFGIEADDSAGVPLSATPAGTLTRLLIEATLKPDDPVPLVALLKHPLARFGLTVEEARRAADILELMALRGGTDTVDISALEAVLEKAHAKHAADRHPPPWRGGVNAEDIALARGLARRIAAAVEPLTSSLLSRSDDSRPRSMVVTLADWAERTGRALEAAAIDERGSLGELWGSEAGEILATLLTGIIETEGQMEADGPQWCDIMEALSASEAVKPRSMRHPRVFIFGALESRLQSVDLVVLGGMNEGTWPGQTSNDPFLSRTMKSGLGLEPPERRIGQLAHDFQMACGTRRLILSRSLRQGSAPTVASRWLQRLQALGGERLTAQLRANGASYLHWMRILDEGERQPLAERPQPKPPAELQPRKYSFSEVTRLRRDPYSIYARRILRLAPIDPFNRDPDAAERGSLYHRIVERFVKGGFD